MAAKAIEKFEDYLHSATDGTDGDRARKSFIRANDYKDYDTLRKPSLRPTRL